MVEVAVPKKRYFTVIDDGDQIKKVRALDEEDALAQAPASVVIIDGTLGSIDGKRIPPDKTPNAKIFFANDFEQFVETGAVCTLVIADPILIRTATYIGKQTIGDESWLAFVKKENRFWVYGPGIQISRINGKKVE